MAVINDRMNQAKNPPPADPKNRNSTVPALPPSLEPEPANGGFFGSFFVGKKKRPSVMEAVSDRIVDGDSTDDTDVRSLTEMSSYYHRL